MNEFNKFRLNHTRRHFLTRAGLGLGSIALGSLLAPGIFGRKQDELETLPLVVEQFSPEA